MNSCTVVVSSVFVVILSVMVCMGKKSCMQSSMGPSDLYQNGVMNPNYMWYRVGRKIQVPVVLDTKYSHKEGSIILGGLHEIQSKTCIEFYVFNHTKALEGYDYVYITNSKQGCWSHIGRIGRGRQELSLGKGCVNHRTAVHEMIHALGFAHEHVRSDRDNYVSVIWGNISPGRENNFAKRNTKNTDPFGPYDYESIMHYDRRAFSQNGMDTLKPHKSDAKIGVYQTMSNWDVKKLLRMYKCGEDVEGDQTQTDGIGRGHGHSGDSPFPSLTNHLHKNIELEEHELEPKNENGDYAHSESDSKQRSQPIESQPNFPNYYHHQTHSNYRLTSEAPVYSPFEYAHAPQYHPHPFSFPQLSNFYNFFF